MSTGTRIRGTYVCGVPLTLALHSAERFHGQGVPKTCSQSDIGGRATTWGLSIAHGAPTVFARRSLVCQPSCDALPNVSDPSLGF